MTLRKYRGWMVLKKQPTTIEWGQISAVEGSLTCSDDICQLLTYFRESYVPDFVLGAG